MVNWVDKLILGIPVYCYSVSEPLKNMINTTASAMGKKWQGFYEKAAKIKDSWARKITMINLQRGHKLFLKTGFIDYKL